MSYCLNPNCQKPQNADGAKFCQNCGSKLLLKERYGAIKLIGQGGFGRTFLSVDEDKPSKPRCVIKQFFPQAQGTDNSQKAAELFEKEAIRLDELGKHPQIPELMAYFTQDGQQYLVQQFIDGQNLAQVLKTEGTFKEQQIRDLLSSLLPVLEFIHSHNVIHRDIKPDNIILRGDKKLVLVDFGAAKMATGTALLKTGTTIGTPEFVAPEQARGKAVFASDLYSLGLTCIYLLTDISPFDLFDPSEDTWVWRDYLVNNPISDELGNVLDKLIQNAIKRRYQSVAEVLIDLKLHNSLSILTSVTPEIPVQQESFSAKKLTFSSCRCIYTLKNHVDAVFSVAFSPDGQLLASGSGYWDKTIKIWNVQTGQEIRTIKGHNDGVRVVTFSPDGKILASGSSTTDKTIKLWEVSTGQEKRTLKGHSALIYSLAFSPDGQTLISGSEDNVIKVWNVLKGQEINTIKGHSSWVRSVAFSPNEDFIASASSDTTIKLWNIRSGQAFFTLHGHSSGVSSVRFSPDGETLASASDDKTIKFWNARTGEQIRTLQGHSGSVFSIAFSPDGELLASGGDDNNIKLWNVRTGEELFSFKEHSLGINSIKFSPNGKIFASCSWDHSIKIWQLS